MSPHSYSVSSGLKDMYVFDVGGSSSPGHLGRAYLDSTDDAVRPSNFSLKEVSS